MSDILDLLSPETISPRAKGGSRKLVLSELSDSLAAKYSLDAGAVFDAIMAREKLGSTGVGEGVAIPHARISGLDRPVGAFARLDEAVDFDAVDDRPCDLIFLLLAPEDSGADHLRALAKVSRVMRQGDIRKALRNAHSVDAVMSAFSSSPTTPKSDAA